MKDRRYFPLYWQDRSLFIVDIEPFGEHDFQPVWSDGYTSWTADEPFTDDEWEEFERRQTELGE